MPLLSVTYFALFLLRELIFLMDDRFSFFNVS
jgi:hypothetical protein